MCAEEELEAKRLSASRDLWFIRLLQGAPGPVPTIEEATDYPYAEREKQVIRANRNKRAVGTPEQVKQKLTELADQFGADELMILTITHDPEARRHSYRLLAEAFGLGG